MGWKISRKRGGREGRWSKKDSVCEAGDRHGDRRGGRGGGVRRTRCVRQVTAGRTVEQRLHLKCVSFKGCLMLVIQLVILSQRLRRSATQRRAVAAPRAAEARSG